MRVFLIGAGVVGREICKAHLSAGMPICIADQNQVHLKDSVQQLGVDADRCRQTTLGKLPAVEIDGAADGPQRTVVIESIAERLDAKQSFFQMAEMLFGDDAILCSNTSTLRIGHIAAKLNRPNRLCGMHFFMPVEQRFAVEVVRGQHTDAETTESCVQHARLLDKTPIVVGDGPGFIVNRLLCPYMNQALLLLQRGVSAARIQRAARNYGMPLSPLELTDWIGTRTMFDAGRVFWQSFPQRFQPSPVLPALIKAQRLGRQCGRGCYDYAGGQRSEELSAAMKEIVGRYQQGEPQQLSDEEVMLLLAIPMWIEAVHAYREQVASSPQQFDLAMQGGLGYEGRQRWLEFFDSVGSRRILEIITQQREHTKSLQVQPEMIAALQDHAPSAALEHLAGSAVQAC